MHYFVMYVCMQCNVNANKILLNFLAPRECWLRLGDQLPHQIKSVIARLFVRCLCQVRILGQTEETAWCYDETRCDGVGTEPG